jgi:uncharacterized protein YjiS (DUF1127 family)
MCNTLDMATTASSVLYLEAQPKAESSTGHNAASRLRRLGRHLFARWQAYCLRRARRETARALLHLDPRLLDDIGLQRCDLDDWASGHHNDRIESRYAERSQLV